MKHIDETNDARCYLDCMELVVAKAQLPPPQALAGMKELDADLRARMDVASTAGRLLNPLTIQLLPALTVVFKAAARGAASNDTADAALAVEQFRRRHGNLLKHLMDLVPECLPAVPADAFDGQPLRFVVRADGYVVYSVGQDVIDQGGTKGPTPNDPCDLTFEVMSR